MWKSFLRHVVIYFSWFACFTRRRLQNATSIRVVVSAILSLTTTTTLKTHLSKTTKRFQRYNNNKNVIILSSSHCYWSAFIKGHKIYTYTHVWSTKFTESIALNENYKMIPIEWWWTRLFPQPSKYKIWTKKMYIYTHIYPDSSYFRKTMYRKKPII